MIGNPKKKAKLKTLEKAILKFKNYSKEDQIKEDEYLKTNVFKELENVNDGFDSEWIYYFSESDFQIVLNRVKKLGIGITGIQPCIDGGFYVPAVVEFYDTFSADSKWYQEAFNNFKITKKNLKYSASYVVPKKSLRK
ncbi:hypothetical protein G1L02_05630 [Tenacibaculum finnmarkense]|uniref:hypothetical protein n=1 Tax=Tenacibaculum finnmarkense TaxID=2781243 RepID=UPI001EFBCCFB|nr:hypothetical protein [Tenacibaculum finnmarkense]MCG8236516.1 hypothetical protein [Tenacibaculum finnmarkense genomovar ulcerans]MCG8803361.1 hypothetical protein [Tenacibaculum finnmarkense]MCG8826176.1 hypothetical protein [Tenacibaculum finnmarkense]MCG8830707.1 hypothetical protein [Tenacibaculum finnmarkense]MCG8859337.1 hypothetical protein [Tenacibaculum finnmarkense]